MLTRRAFLRLAFEVHLNHHVQRRRVIRPLLGETSRYALAIDGMYPMKVFRDEASFVRLDAADEMPNDVELGERFDLALCLLHVALAEMTLSGVICALNRISRLLFADCDDRHIVGALACVLCRNANAFADRRQMLRDISHALS